MPRNKLRSGQSEPPLYSYLIADSSFHDFKITTKELFGNRRSLKRLRSCDLCHPIHMAINSP